MRAGLALFAAVSLAAAGCGEQRGAVTRTTPQPIGPVPTVDARVVASLDVSLADYRLDVPIPRVARAGLIAFAVINDGLVRHALAVDGPAGTVRTRALALGELAVLSVRLPAGTYKWYCPLADHEQRGMVGRVRVAE